MTFLLANFDRPAKAATYSDEHIERQAEIYLANPALRLRGVPFDVFLQAPGEWLLYAANPLRPTADDARQLSSKEIAIVRDGLRRATAVASGSRPIEKLRHHRYPRSTRDFMPLKDA